MIAKTFDCVEMKQRGAERVYETVKGMSVEEELEFWRQITEEMRNWGKAERTQENTLKKP
ncbi:MAG: hypothetical protein IT210_03245 [Armatimonadetes bacterium]|nr:hypothetical protein [Armatimonadota bacterium]